MAAPPPLLFRDIDIYAPQRAVNFTASSTLCVRGSATPAARTHLLAPFAGELDGDDAPGVVEFSMIKDSWIYLDQSSSRMAMSKRSYRPSGDIDRDPIVLR